MSRCRKHEAEPAIQPSKDAAVRFGMMVSGAHRLVRCKHCGMLGTYTNGRQKNGLRRPRWFRNGSAWASSQIEHFTALSELRS